MPDADQTRFDSFKPESGPKKEEPKKEEPPPTPQVRNGKVLLLVLTAAVLLLAIPLGTLWLLGKVGESSSSFDPAVGSCVRNSGNQPVAAACTDEGAYSVVSKVDTPEKCPDPGQPHVTLPTGGDQRVLCLKPASSG